MVTGFMQYFIWQLITVCKIQLYVTLYIVMWQVLYLIFKESLTLLQPKITESIKSNLIENAMNVNQKMNKTTLCDPLTVENGRKLLRQGDT